MRVNTTAVVSRVLGLGPILPSDGKGETPGTAPPEDQESKKKKNIYVCMYTYYAICMFLSVCSVQMYIDIFTYTHIEKDIYIYMCIYIYRDMRTHKLWRSMRRPSGWPCFSLGARAATGDLTGPSPRGQQSAIRDYKKDPRRSFLSQP